MCSPVSPFSITPFVLPKEIWKKILTHCSTRSGLFATCRAWYSFIHKEYEMELRRVPNDPKPPLQAHLVTRLGSLRITGSVPLDILVHFTALVCLENLTILSVNSGNRIEFLEDIFNKSGWLTSLRRFSLCEEVHQKLNPITRYQLWRTLTKENLALESLSFENTEGPGFGDYSSLSRLTCLRSLSLPVGVNNGEQLATLTNLTHLKLLATRVDLSFRWLSSLTRLVSLNIGRINLENILLGPGCLSQLTKLDVDLTNKPDYSIIIKQFPNLIDLDCTRGQWYHFDEDTLIPLSRSMDGFETVRRGDSIQGRP